MERAPSCFSCAVSPTRSYAGRRDTSRILTPSTVRLGGGCGRRIRTRRWRSSPGRATRARTRLCNLLGLRQRGRARSSMGRRATSRLVLSIALSGVIACPVPLSHTVTVAPTVTGVLQLRDSTQRKAVPVALSTGSDSECRHPRMRTTTDSAGRFTFAEIVQRSRVTWIIPGLDVASPKYYVCVGADPRNAPAFHGAGVLNGLLITESLLCTEARLEPERIVCSSEWSRELRPRAR
jgi:hypothetical protein